MAIVQLPELSGFVKRILEKIQPKGAGAFVIFLLGSLGSGKTTFMQAFAKELGAAEQIQSPTFVLMKKYLLKDAKGIFAKMPFAVLIHIDAYRLENPKEFAALRPEEFLNDPQNLVCIEWAENIAGVLPKPDLVLNFSSEGMGEGERRIDIGK